MTDRQLYISPESLTLVQGLSEDATLALHNPNETPAIFKLRTTAQDRYKVKPSQGIVPARGTQNVTVSLQHVAPVLDGYKDQFQCQYRVLDAGEVSPSDPHGDALKTQLTVKAGNVAARSVKKIIPSNIITNGAVVSPPPAAPATASNRPTAAEAPAADAAEAPLPPSCAPPPVAAPRIRSPVVAMPVGVAPSGNQPVAAVMDLTRPSPPSLPSPSSRGVASLEAAAATATANVAATKKRVETELAALEANRRRRDAAAAANKDTETHIARMEQEVAQAKRAAPATLSLFWVAIIVLLVALLARYAF